MKYCTTSWRISFIICFFTSAFLCHKIHSQTIEISPFKNHVDILFERFSEKYSTYVDQSYLIGIWKSDNHFSLYNSLNIKENKIVAGQQSCMGGIKYRGKWQYDGSKLIFQTGGKRTSDFLIFKKDDQVRLLDMMQVEELKIVFADNLRMGIDLGQLSSFEEFEKRLLNDSFYKVQNNQ